MGYRNFFYLVERTYINRIKDLTYEEIQSYYTEIDGKGLDAEEDDRYVSLWDVIPSMNDRKPIYEFGKLYYCDTAQKIMDKGVPLFTNPNTQEHFSEEVPFVCGREALIEAIECWRKKILHNIEEDINKNDEELVKKVRNNLSIRKMDFEKHLNIKDGEALNDSWFYEYTIFNMIHYLKTIDWDKYALIFVGY